MKFNIIFKNISVNVLTCPTGIQIDIKMLLPGKIGHASFKEWYVSPVVMLNFPLMQEVF